MKQFFIIVAGILVAAGIIGFCQQFIKASEASADLEKGLSDLAKVNPDKESSVHQLQMDVDDFDGYSDEYKNRGQLEKILFGEKEDRDFTQAENLNMTEKNLIDTNAINYESARLSARLLKTSDNPDDQSQGSRLKEASENPTDQIHDGELLKQQADKAIQDMNQRKAQNQEEAAPLTNAPDQSTPLPASSALTPTNTTEQTIPASSATNGLK